jgi:hypothetical protein
MIMISSLSRILLLKLEIIERESFRILYDPESLKDVVYTNNSWTKTIIQASTFASRPTLSDKNLKND